MDARFEIDPASTPETLVIRDVGHATGMSITNDAEAVLAHLVGHGALTEGRRLMYYDSDGNLDEILVHDGRFAGFRPGPLRRPVGKPSDEFLSRLAQSLDSKALREFGEIEQLLLRRAMETVGMASYPNVAGRESGEIAEGCCLCPVCGHQFFEHPMDWRLIGYGNVPFLNVLCDGRRVKL